MSEQPAVRTGFQLLCECGFRVLKLQEGGPGFVKVTTEKGTFEYPVEPEKVSLQ